MSDSVQSVTKIGGLSNAVVVQLEGRAYPGIVIQGDTLTNLKSLIEESQALLKANNREEALDLVEEILSIVSGFEQVYTKTLNEKDINNPI